MSKTIQGNLLSITHGVFAHQVNLMGVMGTLLAKQIKQRYPTVYAQYRLALGCNRLVLGDSLCSEMANVFGELQKRDNVSRLRDYCLRFTPSNFD
jgi:hypothetical protein